MSEIDQHQESMDRDNVVHFTDAEIEQYLAEQFEGGLFAEISITSIGGGTFIARRDLYTVLDGVCYEVGSGKLVHTGDTMLNIKKDCHRIGKYDPNKKYKFTVSRSYTYAEMKKLFKL